MKQVFKVLSLVVVIMMVFSLVASAQCKYDHDKKIVLGFSQIGAESAWRVANTDSIKAEAEKRSECFELKFSILVQILN